ncbi:uncharacterized protein LOC127637930 isoform X4 [Xyrauchen texanus]|uniref:uncharacterized protein LOC127637930 isoform X4 n=1 Tax=Xyrauchen texanus TaxID=154827 RepID=UPI0022423747|nr:uncharacterized protein LOC127637930 isoform X4 [Xyrauchen texanus]
MSMAAVRRVVKKVQASRTLPESRCVVDCKRQQWKRSRSLSQTKWMQLKCHCFYTKRITEGFCDSQRRFCHVSVGHPGSWHDSRAYRLSEIFLSCSIISPRQYKCRYICVRSSSSSSVVLCVNSMKTAIYNWHSTRDAG